MTQIIGWGFLLVIIAGAAAETPQDGSSKKNTQLAGNDLLLIELERTRKKRAVAATSCDSNMCKGFQYKYFDELQCKCLDCCYASDQKIKNNIIIEECYEKNQDCNGNGYAIWAACGRRSVQYPPEGTPPNEFCPRLNPTEKSSTDSPTYSPSTLPTSKSLKPSSINPTNKPPTDNPTEAVSSTPSSSTIPSSPSAIVWKPWEIGGLTAGAIGGIAVIILIVLMVIYKKYWEKKVDDIQSAQNDTEASGLLIEPSSCLPTSPSSIVPMPDSVPCADTGGNEDGTDTTPIVQSAPLASHDGQIQFDPVVAAADTTCIDVINDNIEASYERTMALQAERKTSMPSDNVSMETLDDSSIKAEESDDQRPNNPDSGFVTGGSMDQSLSSSKPESTECLSDGEGVSWSGQVLSLDSGAAAKSDNAINLDSLHQSVDLKPNADKVIIDISPQGNVVEKAAEKLQHVADQRAFQENQERPNGEQGATSCELSVFKKWNSGQESTIADLVAFKEYQEKRNIEQDVFNSELWASKCNQEKINAQQSATNHSNKTQITALANNFPEGVPHLAVGCLKNMAFLLINPITYQWARICVSQLSCDHKGCNGSCFDAQGYVTEVIGIPLAYLLPKLKENHCYKLAIRFKGQESSDEETEKSISFKTTDSTCKASFDTLLSDMKDANEISKYLDTEGKGEWVRQMLAQLMDCIPEHEHFKFYARGVKDCSVIQDLLEIKPEWPVVVLLICLRHFKMQDAIDKLSEWHQDCPVCRDLYRGNQVGDRRSYKVIGHEEVTVSEV